MMTRILTSIMGIPAVLLLLFWPGGRPWFWFVAAVMAMGIYEFTRGLWAKGIYVHWWAIVLCAGGTLLVAANYRPLMPAPGMMLVLLVLAVLAIDLLWKRRAPLKNVGATLVGIGWLAVTFPFLMAIRGTGDTAFRHAVSDGGIPVPFGLNEGPWMVLAVLLIIWADDSAAYFVGKAFGKHKMAPAISPNKTWEGSIGGLVAAWAVGVLMTSPVLTHPAQWLLFGLVIGVVGQIGDLVESAIKREIGIKDFGELLPGHGGVLDRFDSLIFAAPVAYAILNPDWLQRIAVAFS